MSYLFISFRCFIFLLIDLTLTYTNLFMNRCTLLILNVLLFFSTFLFAQIPAGYKSVKDTLAFKQKMEAQSKLVNTIESDFPLP